MQNNLVAFSKFKWLFFILLFENFMHDSFAHVISTPPSSPDFSHAPPTSSEIHDLFLFNYYHFIDRDMGNINKCI